METVYTPLYQPNLYNAAQRLGVQVLHYIVQRIALQLRNGQLLIKLAGDRAIHCLMRQFMHVIYFKQLYTALR